MKHPCASGTSLNDGAAILDAVKQQNRYKGKEAGWRPYALPMIETEEEAKTKRRFVRMYRLGR